MNKKKSKFLKRKLSKAYDKLLERQDYFFDHNPEKETDDEETESENEMETLLDEDRPRKWMLRQNSKKKFWFDMLIISLATFNVFTVPFDIAFQPSYNDHPGYITLVWMINIIFVIDIFVNLRTTYINIRTGDEVWNPKMIAKRYILGGRFWIDLLSALPLDEFFADGSTTQDVFATVGILKIVRVARLSKVIQNLNIKQDIKAYLKVCNLALYLVIYLHFIAWVFWYVVDINKAWIPGLDFIYATTTIYNNSVAMKYYTSIYHAVMLFGLNEVYAHTTEELIVVWFLMLISSIVNANIFGVMAVLVSEANKKEVEFQELIVTANTAMNNLGVPIVLRREIKQYISNKHSQQRQEELVEFLRVISPSLRFKVTKHIFFNEAILLNNVLYDIMENDPKSAQIIKFLLNRLQIDLAEPEQVLIEQNEPLDKDPTQNFFYIIAKGEWDLITWDTSNIEKKSIKVNILMQGDYFGEIALLYNCKRTASVVCSNYCTLGKLDGLKFKQFMSKFSNSVEERLKNVIYNYKDPKTMFLLETINKIDYFTGISETTKRDIVFNLTPVSYERDSWLFKTGEEADRMYIIDSGMVEIYITIEKDVEFVIDRLYKGSVINHKAFLFHDEIDTYARCASPVTLYYIKLEDIDSIRIKDKYIDSKINKIEESMVIRGNVVAIDYIISEPKERQKNRPPAVNARRNELTHILKNAVMYHIGQNREKRKTQNIASLFLQAVERKNKEMQAARKKTSSDYVEYNGNYLTENEYEFINDIIEKIYKVKSEHSIGLETLQKKFEILMKSNKKNIIPIKNKRKESKIPKEPQNDK